MVVDGGVYTSNGEGSPAVYVTADVSIHDAELNATGSEALCMEGLNTVRLHDCDLSGDMEDLPQNDNTWTVIVYQSMSGDAQIGKGRFEMSGGTLTIQLYLCMQKAQYDESFGIALVLLVFVLAINMLTKYLSKKFNVETRD